MPIKCPNFRSDKVLADFNAVIERLGGVALSIDDITPRQPYLARLNEAQERAYFHAHFLWNAHKTPAEIGKFLDALDQVRSALAAEPAPAPAKTPAPATKAENESGRTPSVPDLKAEIDLARALVERLRDPSQKITAKVLQLEASKAYGAKLSEGKFDRKDIQDALELAVNMHIMQTPGLRIDAGGSAKMVMTRLESLLNDIPAQRVRSEEQQALQQFSTPPNYSAAAVYAANLRDGDVMLEPSAGTGSIVAAASKPGVKIIANELSERRTALLRELLGNKAEIFRENAEQLNNTLPDSVKPTVVVMNPPFSQTAGRLGDRKVPMTGAIHIEQALKRLEDGGRLVAIVGRGMTMGAPTFRAWWSRISKEYAVRANIGVEGKVYEKYGTTFGTRLLVIDKVKPDGTKPVLADAQTVDDLMRELEPIRNARPAAEQHSAQPSGAAVAEGSQDAGAGALPASADTGGVGAGERGAGGLAGGRAGGAAGAGERPVRVEAEERDGMASEQSERAGQRRTTGELAQSSENRGGPAGRGGARPQRDLQPAGEPEHGLTASGERIELEHAEPGEQGASAAGDEPMFSVREGTVKGETDELAAAVARRLYPELRAELDRMGLTGTPLNLPGKLTAKMGGKQFELNGHYFQKAITVALNADDIRQTMHHESLHALRDLGLFKDSEWQILANQSQRTWRRDYNIDKHYAHRNDDVRTEEGVAFAYADWATGKRKVDGRIARLFKRIRDFLEALGNVLRGRGFKTAEDVFRDVKEGKIGARGKGEDIQASLKEAAAASEKPMFSIRRDRNGEWAGGKKTEKPTERTKEADERGDRDLGLLSRAIDKAVNIGDALYHSAVPQAIRDKIIPMAGGPDEWRASAKDYANFVREVDWNLDRHLTDIKNKFTPEERRRMWDAANEEGEALEAGKSTEGIGLSTLNKRESAFVKSQQADANKAWEQARSLGMVEGEGKPSYVPRMVVRMAQSGHYERAGTSGVGGGSSEYGRGFRTKTGSMNPRRYRTAAETEAAMKAKFGEEAQIARDIASLPLATAKLRKAVAARILINKLKALSNEYGANLTSDSARPDYFTLDHPAFYDWRPQLKKNETTGKWESAKYSDGSIAFEKNPIYIHNDFKGPLVAVLGKDAGKIYRALMTIRSKSMVLVMYSPVIHNMVEFSRALPVMPGKVLGLSVYFKGNAAKHDKTLMQEAIRIGGLVPIGNRFAMGQEMSSIMEEPNLQPGRSWTSQVLAYVPDLYEKGAGDKVRQWVDDAGDFWHNTLLWDRVADLQAGIYVLTRDGLIEKGYTRSTAVRMAAHLANRYAGSLPLEAMSTEARKLANLVLFSRTFTFGNLGAMKDMATGMPKDVMAQIERDAGQQEADKARAFMRRKSTATVMLDIALGIVSTSILASAVAVLVRDKSVDEELQGYVRRFDKLMKTAEEKPFDVLMHPLNTLWSLTPAGEQEPQKRNAPYIRVGTDKNGAAVYVRNPFGKMGEDFTGWMTQPFETFKRKEGIFARPTQQAITNDVGFPGIEKSPVFDTRPDANQVKNIGRFVALYLEAPIPTEVIKAGAGIAGIGPYQKSSQEVNIGKIVGPLGGVTISKGYPGGKGYEAYKRDEKRLRKLFD